MGLHMRFIGHQVRAHILELQDVLLSTGRRSLHGASSSITHQSFHVNTEAACSLSSQIEALFAIQKGMASLPFDLLVGCHMRASYSSIVPSLMLRYMCR